MAERILLVDATASNRILWKVRLDEAGHAVSQAESCAAALARARADPPALAVIDADLAESGPLELCRALRALPGLAGLPVLMLARCPGAAFRQSALEAGAAEVLEKPVDGALLVAWLRHLLRVRAREREFAELGTLPMLEDMRETVELSPPGRIALVAAGTGRGDWGDLIGALSPHLCLPIDQATAPVALSQARPTDLVVIDGAGASEAALIDCISRLRSLSASRNAGLVVLGTGESERAAIRLLELDADDLVPAAAGLAERRSRILRALLTQRHRQRQRRALRRGLELSLTDPLTGLGNRRLASRRLSELCSGEGAARLPFALLMLDIDHFKRINDTHGHPSGDAVLRELARRMQSTIREGEFLARIGGEEFLAILPGASSAEARARAEKLRRVVSHTPVPLPQGGGVQVTMSIGLAFHSGGERTGRAGEEILARADRALLRAKAAGRNTVTLFRQAA